MSQRSFAYRLSIFHPDSVIFKFVSLALVWALVFTSLPVYAVEDGRTERMPKSQESPRLGHKPSQDGGVSLLDGAPLGLNWQGAPFSSSPAGGRARVLPSLTTGRTPGRVAKGNAASTAPARAASLIGGELRPFRSGIMPMMQSNPPGTSSIASNFNGTAIPAGDSVWFSSVVKVNGLGSTPVRVFLRAATVQFTAAGNTYNLAVPDATITFSPNTTTATTVYDPNRIEWITAVPSSGLAGNVFLSGFGFAVPAGGLPGGINPVTWTGTFYSDTAGVSINWQWASAVYTSLAADNRSLGVKPVDDNQASQYKNSDHAGTPESFESFVTGGAMGGGGSNFTGSYSGTAGVTPINQVPNYPPVANAGPNQSVHVTDTVQLDGTRSSDRDGDPLTYRWSFVSVPTGSNVVLNNATTAQPTFTVDRRGAFVVQLIVNDGFVNSPPATVTITTLNSPPVANAGPNQTVFAGTTVHLDGSGSTDVDGDSLTYKWALTSAPGGSTAQLSSTTAVKPTFTADVVGTYVAQLVVNDGLVDSAPATVAITTINSPPVANAGPNQTIQAGQTVNLDGTKSSDVDGDPLTYRWSIVAQPSGSTAVLSNPTSPRPSFLADKTGTFTVQLIVNDGFVDSTPATVTITTQNAPPVANAGPNQTVFVKSTVTLNGSGSTDVDGDALTYRWSLLNVPTGSTAQLTASTTVNPTFVADLQGIYVAQLIVNDGFVDSPPATVSITTINSPPVANAGPDQTVVGGSTVKLDGSRSTDVDGDSLTFKWSITTKPSNSNATLSDPSAVTPSFVADQLGTYVMQLVVNDGTFDSAPSTVTITTQDSPPTANAGPAQSVPFGAVVTLDGSGSFDPDGQSVTYQWSLVGVPAGSQATLANPTSVHPTFTVDVAGNYVAQLIVNDGFFNSVPATVMISTINSIPVANAGPNQTVNRGATVQLDGSASNDADHDPLTYRWSITVRPTGSTAALSDSTAVKPTFVADIAGTYVAQLIVNDGKVDSAPATVMIVALGPPVITTTPQAPATVLPGQTETPSFPTQNTGQSNATQVVLQVTNPDGSLFTVPTFALATGQSTVVSSTFNVPVVPAKQNGETDTAYQARLFAIDNSPLNFKAQLTWTDAFANNFGPTQTPFASTEVLPVLTIMLSAPATATAGDKITYTITLTNNGHAAATIGALTLTLPDGTVATAVPAQGTLAPGASTTATVPFTIPISQQAGAIMATAQVTWTDANNNAYGPISSMASTQVAVAPTVLASCLPTSSLSVLMQGQTVTSYVPNGNWGSGATGIRFVPVEGNGPTAAIATPHAVNSCSSNSVTGQTVCTANNTDVYLLQGSALSRTLTSGSTAFASFSGGSCQNCGVAINPATNQAVIAMGLTGGAGIQFLDLNTNTFAAPIPATTGRVSEDVSVDPGRGLVLSASEDNVYGLFKTDASGTRFFSNAISPGSEFDSSAEDCTTGIAVASSESSAEIFVADLTQATFTPGPPATWSAPKQLQSIPEFAGGRTSGISIAPGSHLGLVTGEFGGNFFGVFELPAISGSGTPAILDWVVARIPNEPTGTVFSFGGDPHTVTAYTSPNSGRPFGLVADSGPGFLAAIDLQAMMSAHRTGAHTVDPSVDLVGGGLIRFIATAPTLGQPAPNSGQQGQQNLSVTISGFATNFVQGTTTATFGSGSGITIASFTVNSPTSATATLNIDPITSTGFRALSVTTGTQVLSLTNAFQITAGPAALTLVNPSSGQQGQQGLSVAITGQSTHFAQGSTSANFNSGIAVASLTVNSPTSATAVVNIDPLTFLGARTVTVSTIGESASGRTFTVTAGPAQVTQVSPNTGPVGQQNLTVTITGQATHFVQGLTTANFGAGITVASLTVNSATRVTAVLNISAAAALGARNVTVSTSSETATLTGGFTVTAGVPVITALTPVSGQQGQQNLSVSLTGAFTHFVQGTTSASFGAGVTVASLTINSATSATAVVNIDPAAATGGRNVTLSTGTEAATLIGGFSVTPGTPVITLVSPNTGAAGQQNLSVTVTGRFTHFAQGSTSAFFGGIPVASVTVNSPTSATAVLNIPLTAAVGPRTVELFTGGEVVVLTNGFSVTSAPVLALINPGGAQQGTQNLSVSIAGQNTHFVQGTTTATFGAGVAVVSVTVSSATAATVVISIDPAAAAGARDVTLTTGTEVVTRTGGFTVLPPPPAVSTNLTEGAIITNPTQITGSVNSGSWSLRYALASADGTVTNPVFTTFSSGTNAVSNGALGTLDPTVLLNGNYIVQLTSTDQFGQTSTVSSSVDVERNAKVGNFTLSFTDMNVPAPGLPIAVTRTYDSRDKGTHDFGVGWTLSLVNVRLQKNGKLGANWQMTQSGGLIPNFCLQETKPHIVTITFPDNKAYKFEETTSPQCQQASPLETTNLTFTQLPGTTGTQGATLQIVGDNSALVNPPSVGLVDLLDFNTLDDANPTVFQLMTAEGFVYVIDETKGATSVTDPNRNSLTINASGIISSAGKSVVFRRDSQGRITQISDPVGNNLNYTYSAAGDLASFTDAVRNVTTFTYDPTHLLTNIFDPRGVQAIKNIFDASGRLISTTDGNGNTTTFTTDVAANHETITDALGNASLYQYDADGNVISVTDPLGNVTTSTFDANDNKLTETNAVGATTTSTYDAAGNETSVTDPLSHVTSMTYNALKQPLTITDKLGRVTTNTLDASGNLTSAKNALGNATSYTLNAHGQPLTVTDPLGNQTTYVYDASGNMTQETDALGRVSNFTYDANGNRLSQKVTRTKADGTTETLTTQYQYDAANRLVKTINPDGTSQIVAYNALGKKSDTTDPLGRKTHYDYDGAGRLTKTTYPDGTTEVSVYDAKGQRISMTDRASRTTTFTYDPVGRRTKITYPGGSSKGTGYDAIGRAVQTIDELGHVTHSSYDAANRLISTTDALGHVTTFSYDAAGNQISQTDALGRIIQFVYDGVNRRVQTTYADGTTSSAVYDAAGRQTSKTDQAGKTAQYAYDSLGRLISTTDALGQITKYAYDEVGNRISQTDANNHTAKVAYDQLGRPVGRALPLGMSESYAYDAVGNLTSKTDFNGHVTTYSYDSMNRQLSRVPDAAFGAPTVSYTYTANGRRASMTDASGSTTYTYDSRDRLLSKATPFGTLTYTYDAAGNILSLKSSNAGGASMAYAYDALNRLASVTDASGTTTYSYDAVGNLASFAYPNGVQTSYNYNTLNRLTNVQSTCNTAGPSCTAPGTAIAGYAYTLGAAGNRLSVADLSGRTVQYSYDADYRLASETIAGAASQNGAITYTYDAVGNRTQRSSTVPAVPATGLLTYDANDRTTTDAYDNNGNLTNNGTPNLYDFENRLVGRGGVSVVYDGDGTRVGETVAGVTTNYLVSNSNPTGYAQVMDELQGGVVTRSYSLGLELLNQSAGGTTRFYGYDGHGSVRFLTDPTGAITDTYDYDAFGNLINQTGTTPNNYLFAGQQFDPALGIYYNRARYYDQRIGRFWTMDTLEGDPQSPLSLHRYLYVGADPVDRTDPSGNEFLTDFAISIYVRVTLFTMAYPTFFAALAYVISALNIYWFITDEEYRGVVISAGPNAAVEMLAADVRIITTTSAELFRTFKSFGLAASGLEQLAALRVDLSLPAAGSAADKSTLAKLVIGDANWFGINAHGQDVTLQVNAISASHAETDVFQQAFNTKSQFPQAFTSTEGTLYVDRELCGACGQRGAVKSLARQVGLTHLTVVTPNGIVDWDLTQP